MEEQLFTWKNFALLEDENKTLKPGCFLFSNVSLVRGIKDIPAGTYFDYALLDFEKGILQLYTRRDNEVPLVNEVKLRLEVE